MPWLRIPYKSRVENSLKITDLQSKLKDLPVMKKLMYFSSDGVSMITNDRSYGLPVRPVWEE